MIIIFRGVSGSGKSRFTELLKSLDFKFGPYEPVRDQATLFVKSLWGSIMASEHKLYDVSADSYYTIDGSYKFDPKFLGAAHAACLRNYYEVVRDPKAAVIVDNTNCSLSEFVPYAALANAFNHELHILTLLVDPVVAWKRNKHEVPFSNIAKQDLTLRQSILDMPPWFPQQIFPGE